MTFRALCVFLMCLVVYVAALPADTETLVGAESAYRGGWGDGWGGRGGWGWGGYGSGNWGGRLGYGNGYWGRAGWGGYW